MTFKRTTQRTFLSFICRILEIPLVIIRDISIPMCEASEWNRNRAAILPITMPVVFCFLAGQMDFALEICGGLLLPGLVCSLLVLCKTKKTVPPKGLMLLFSVLAFVMAIMWISFLSDIVIDLL